MPDKTTPDESKATVDTRRDEEVESNVDEAGRFDTGLGGTAERPAGTPSDRDFTTAESEDVKSDDDRSPAG